MSSIPQDGVKEAGSATPSSEVANADRKNASINSAGVDVPSEFDADGEIKQDGVRRTEAITSVWDRKTLVLVFITYVFPLTPQRHCFIEPVLTRYQSLYLASFAETLLSAVQTNLNPYITSEFGEHGLTAVVSIVSTITGGVCNLFIAKVLDIWGRVEGFFLMLFLIVTGAIMKAACHNIETYAAANTIYWVSDAVQTAQ